METVTIKKSKTCQEKICPDYDNECCDVSDPVICFLGEIIYNGKKYNIGIAGGICPEMRRRN